MQNCFGKRAEHSMLTQGAGCNSSMIDKCTANCRDSFTLLHP